MAASRVRAKGITYTNNNLFGEHKYSAKNGYCSIKISKTTARALGLTLSKPKLGFGALKTTVAHLCCRCRCLGECGSQSRCRVLLLATCFSASLLLCVIVAATPAAGRRVFLCVSCGDLHLARKMNICNLHIFVVNFLARAITTPLGHRHSYSAPDATVVACNPPPPVMLLAAGVPWYSLVVVVGAWWLLLSI